MKRSVWLQFRRRHIATAFCVAAIGSLIGAAAAPALAAGCPGNPDALGTSRTLVVDPREHPRIGTMQYAETLPLQDREVVLTFDDGPLPRQTDQILDSLDAECVKATFFVVGRMARDFPDTLRRIGHAGHTIGTHTQNHPFAFNTWPAAQARQEIDAGIAATNAALGGAAKAAPFFRIPGLRRGVELEDYLASQGLQTWSADFPADDWRHISSDQVLKLALSRLEAKGKGILLLHDIQARTVDALPQLLRTLKARGFRVVHVVAATPNRPKTPTEARQWKLHASPEPAVAARWPAIPRFAFAATAALPGPLPTRTDFYQAALPFRPVTWPVPAIPESGGAALPVPAEDIFQMPDRSAMQLGRLLHSAPMVEPAAQRARVATAGMKRPAAADLSASRRPIAGSLPVRDPSLQRGPALAR